MVELSHDEVRLMREGASRFSQQGRQIRRNHIETLLFY